MMGYREWGFKSGEGLDDQGVEIGDVEWMGGDDKLRMSFVDLFSLFLLEKLFFSF